MPPSREFWYCGGAGKGHIVGEVRTVSLMRDAGRVKVLELYESAQAVPPEDVPTLRSEKIFHAEGLRCSICGNRFDWFPSLPSLVRLLKRYDSTAVEAEMSK
ncbi:MAG: hypothetical protein LC130_14420 [Bryobacterales bacterium]|nr:hypothetical protein [Bryobacterales bacterium]MCZ2287511.1 hypothetical protein [Anaerolineales bacterium]